MSDWLFDHLGIIIGILAIVFVVIITWAIIEANAEEREFMTACTKDHKSYECRAMWRAGETHTTVVPMPVYTGR